MSGCVRNIHTTNYQNLIIGFQVTAKNVGDVFLGHSVVCVRLCSVFVCLEQLDHDWCHVYDNQRYPGSPGLQRERTAAIRMPVWRQRHRRRQPLLHTALLALSRKFINYA